MFLYTDHRSNDDEIQHNSRSSTPFPTEILSTPPWNPTTADITRDVEATSDTAAHHISASTAVSSEAQLKHVLLNPALAGKSVKVVMNDGNTIRKETVVSLHCTNGLCSMRTIHYHTSVQVMESTVTPKYPSPTHDNGLVLVIKGEHAGKHGRRLYHSKRNGQVYMIMEVVIVQQGQKDQLTGEVLELSPDHLCVADESVQQKKINADVMKELRQTYRSQIKRQ